MHRARFRIPAQDKEEVLDALLPLLPAGVREHGDELSALSGRPFDRAALEAAAGRSLEGWAVDEVPADWRVRRALMGGGGVLIADRVFVRSPWDPAPAGDLIDVIVERRGSAFGTGSHPTTQMCIALMLDIPPAGACADLGCGVGTLAIVAAKLGWSPVVGVDRVPVAIEVARENAERNGVDVSLAVADLAVDAVPLAALLLINAPPPVHARVADAMTGEVRHVIVSGIVSEEVEPVVSRYRELGFEVASGLGTEDEWVALRLSC